jgi:organic hydroperoxide reductase OsmC/OhrA
MQPLPHHYTVRGIADVEGDVRLENDHLPALASASPVEFGGPGNRWSPEELFVGAVADCFLLTFRGIARASKFAWSSLSCDVDGTLERVDRVTRFTSFGLRATLQVPPGTDEARARILLDRAERTCLITQSLKATTHLEATVEVRA